MDNYLSSHATRNPGSIAIEDGSLRLTYNDLEREVDKLYSVLKGYNFALEEPICILEGVNAQLVISQLAAIRARLTCVPVEPCIPKLRLKDMLDDIGCKTILSDGKNIIDDNAGFTVIPVTGHEYSPQINGNDQGQMYSSSTEGIHDYRSHILFTSGSSGKPKAVQIPERAILHLVTNTPVTPLQPSDRVPLINNPGFDVSLFEVFAPLVAGATMVPVPRMIVTDPFMFRQFIAENKLSLIIMTAALLSITGNACPAAFGDVKHVLNAGDYPNPGAMKAILESSAPPQHLWNTYGPTEATTYSTMHEITIQELEHESISVGKPVGDTKLCLVDENLTVITKPGEIDEILLGGPGMTLGYVNLPVENQSRFVMLDDGVKYYRTGDLARWRQGAPDLLEFCGRSDHQVKQGGFRVELGEIEQTLLASGLLCGAIVLQITPRNEDEEAFLVAFVIPAVLDTVRSRSLVEYLKQRLPSYMIPKDFVFCSQYPLTEHDKVDRNALHQQYRGRKGEQKSMNGQADNRGKDTASVLKNIWISLLTKDAIEDDDDFFTLGGTSIQSAALIARIRKYLDKTISMRSLHENSRLRNLANYLDECVEGGNAPQEALSWIKDSKLADDLYAVPDWQAEDEGRVFVTGVTGFVGAYFLSRFLQMPSVKEIVCIARPKNGQKSSDRVQSTLERYDLWLNSEPEIHKLRVLSGDISLDHLGLSQEQFDWLANWASVIFHLAAKVNFCEPYTAHYDSNILGTKNVLALAASGRRKSFQFMSSIDTWGPTGLVLGTRKCLEDGTLEEHAGGLSFDIGYAQSKWAAEQMVRRARARGIPTVIYRPGFIIGHSKTGAGNPDDFFARLMVGSIRLGAFPILPNQRLEYVTIDYVVDATLHIASSNEHLGKSYSLVAPDPKDSVNLEKTLDVIRGAGYPLQYIPYWDWVRLLQKTNDLDNPLMPIMPLLQEPVLNGMSRFETSRNTPHYDSSNAVAALKNEPGIRYIPFDSDILSKFLYFWDRKGFYEIPGI